MTSLQRTLDFYIASLEYKVNAISIDAKTIYAEEFCVESDLNVMNVNNEWFSDFNVHGNIVEVGKRLLPELYS